MKQHTEEELIYSLHHEVSKLRELNDVLKKVPFRAKVREYEDLIDKLPEGENLYVITSTHLSQIRAVLSLTSDYIEDDVNSLSELTDESDTMDSGEQRQKEI